MRRLAFLTLALTGALAASVVAAGALGALRPPGVFSLDGYDCEPPCWQGIAPGATSANRARQLLYANPYVAPGSVRYNTPSTDYEDTGDVVWAVQDESAGLLRRASAHVEGWVVTALDVPGLDVRLGDMVALLGAPAWVMARYVPGEDRVRLVVDVFYPELEMRLAVQGDAYPYLSPALRVSRVYYGGRQGAPQLGGSAALFDSMAWQGFVSLRRYGVGGP
ncbi:MAG: hypothetical protein Kow00120_27750 [Anaerolineae bacterium]